MEDRQVSLKQVLDTVDEMPVIKDNNGMEFIEKSLAKTRIWMLQSELNEWCTDCKEYDQERHCCPRWNRVIRQTVEEYKAAQPSFSQPHENDHIADDSKKVVLYEDAVSRQAAIDTEGLDEQIRCEMCRNPMHTDRGCDGNCKYDEKLYERIMQILGERIKPLLSAQPEKRTGERTETHGVCLDVIDRQAAVDALRMDISIIPFAKAREYVQAAIETIYNRLEDLPSTQPDTWMEQNRERILEAGMEGREVEFRIGGRLFAIREKAQ